MTTLIPPAYARATRRIAPHVGAQTSLDIAVTDGITNGMPRPLTGRVKPGSVAAVVAEYFDSQQFFASKGAGNSNLVGCSTGMSAGFAPRNILSMYSAPRRQRSGKSAP